MLGTTYVGLDIHRKSIVATALSAQGDPLDHAKLGPSTVELEAFLERLPGPKHVVMEPCTIWEPLYDALHASGARVTLTNPLRTRLIGEATIKTDKIDSEALATLARLHAIPEVYVPPPEIRAVRRLFRDRVFYRRKLTAVMNHTYGQLIRRNVPYPDQILRTKKGRAAMAALQIPEVNRALETIDHLLDQCKRLDREIHTAFEGSDEAQLLKSIPGIGEYAAVGLAAYLCPIERFPTIERLSSYVGLAPSTHQSGEFAYQGKLKWDSNELLQWLLIEISWSHRRKAPRGDVARVGTRVGRRRGKGKGTVAAAHKLLKIIYAILKERRAFLPHAPERPAAMQHVRDPRKGMAAMQCVRGTALGPVAADRLPAH